MHSVNDWRLITPQAHPPQLVHHDKDPSAISQLFQDVLSQYLSPTPKTIDELKEQLKQLTTSQFEACLKKIEELHRKRSNLDSFDPCIEIIFFHGMSLTMHEIEKDSLTDINSLKINLCLISPFFEVSGVRFSYDFLIDRERRRLSCPDSEQFIEKIKKDFQCFVNFPQITRDIFYPSPSRKKFDKYQFFWKCPKQAIEILDILLTYGYGYRYTVDDLRNTVEGLTNTFKGLIKPINFNQSKEIQINILQLLKKHAWVWSNRDYVLIDGIKQCFKEIQEIDFDNDCLICKHPGELLGSLAHALSMKTIKFLKTSEPEEEQGTDLFGSNSNEIQAIEPKEKKRSRSKQHAKENDQDTKLAKQSKLTEEQLPLSSTEADSHTPSEAMEGIEEEIPTESQPKTELNAKKRKRENSPLQEKEMKAAKLQKLDPRHKALMALFESCKNSKLIIDLSVAEDLSLEDLSLLSKLDSTFHLQLNGQILHQQTSFSFDSNRLKFTWQIDSPLNESQLEIMRKNRVVELKINTSTCSSDHILKIMTMIQPKNLTLFVNNHLSESNITREALQACRNLKKVIWNLPLETPQQRTIFCDLIDRGIEVFSNSLMQFFPRENIHEDSEEVRFDVFNCAKVMDYILRRNKDIKALDELLALTDADTHLLTQFPLAGLASLHASSYDLTKIDARSILKTLEDALVKSYKQANAEAFDSKQFTRIFTKETVALYPQLACALWPFGGEESTENSTILFLLDIFPILIPSIHKRSEPSGYYISYFKLIKAALKLNIPLENLSSQLNILYKAFIEIVDIADEDDYTANVNELLEIHTPEITEEYIQLFAFSLRDGFIDSGFNFLHLAPSELKRLIPCFIAHLSRNEELIVRIVDSLPVDQIIQDPKSWVPLLEKIPSKHSTIVSHFDRCHPFLSAETKHDFAVKVLLNPCSYEFFEPAFRMLINFSNKFARDRVGLHLANLLKFISKNRHKPIIVQMNRLLDVPNQPHSFILEVLTQAVKEPLTAALEEDVCLIFEHCFVLPNRQIHLPNEAPETLKTMMCEICKKHSFYYPFILTWLIETAIKSGNVQECIDYIQTQKLPKDSWMKIFSTPVFKEIIVDRFLEHSIHCQKELDVESFLQALAQNIFMKEDPQETTRELIKFVELSHMLFLLKEPSRNPINIPIALISPLITVIEKENLIVRYPMVISRLLGECISTVIQDEDLSVSFINILLQIKKAKKDCTSKEEKNKYKRLSNSIYDYLYTCITRQPDHPNIFGFCVKFIAQFQDQLLADGLEKFKEMILNVINKNINKGQFDLPQELAENFSALYISQKDIKQTIPVQNHILANALIKKFLSKWKDDVDYQFITSHKLRILFNCLAYPIGENEQRLLSDILSNCNRLHPDCTIEFKPQEFAKENALFCRLFLDRCANQPFQPHTKNYISGFIGCIVKSGLFSENKEMILHLINSLGLQNFIEMFCVSLTVDELSYISSKLVKQPNPSKFLSHPMLHLETTKIMFYLSRFKSNQSVIRQKASEIGQVEIVLPAGGETLDLNLYLEYFQKIDEEVVQSYASSDLIKSARKNNTTCHALYTENLKNLITVLTKNEDVHLAPKDEDKRRHFYGVIVHDLKASLFHIHSHIKTLIEEKACEYLNQQAQIFITLAEAGQKGRCIFPYQQAAHSIYRMVVPHSESQMDMEKIEGRITRKVLEFLWVCINKVIAADPASINVHRQNAYIKFFGRIFGSQIDSTKVITEDPALDKELEILNKPEMFRSINNQFTKLFKLATCFNFVCENWGQMTANPKGSYNVDHLNRWLEDYAKKKGLKEVPYQQAWNEDGSFPWPGLLEILVSTGIFEKKFPEECSKFDLIPHDVT